MSRDSPAQAESRDDRSRGRWPSWDGTVGTLAAVVLAAGMAALCSACASTTTPTPGLTASSSLVSPVATPRVTSSPQSSPTPTSLGCVIAPEPTPSSIDGVLQPIAGYTLVAACASDIDSSFSRLQTQAGFDVIRAGSVLQNGAVVLKFIVGQVNSVSADAYADTFLSEMSARAAQSDPPKAVAEESMEVGGYRVTHFNVAADTEGYLHADGSTVVIAYLQSGELEAGNDAFTEIVANVH